jgi:hypothetical protein
MMIHSFYKTVNREKENGATSALAGVGSGPDIGGLGRIIPALFLIRRRMD